MCSIMICFCCVAFIICTCHLHCDAHRQTMFLYTYFILYYIIYIQIDVLIPSDLTSTYTSHTSSSESPSLAKLTIQRHRQSTLYNIKQIYSNSNTSSNNNSSSNGSNSVYNNVYTTRGVIIMRDTFIYEVCIQ